jgi:hypothetical protein
VSVKSTRWGKSSLSGYGGRKTGYPGWGMTQVVEPGKLEDLNPNGSFPLTPQNRKTEHPYAKE